MITSLHLKTALMAYWRFKKQSLCCDEVGFAGGNSDILVDTGKEIIDIEVKISKSDLKADIKKPKHEANKNQLSQYISVPNKFYICVPTCLVEEAKKWTEEVNPNYGVLEFSEVKYESYKEYPRYYDKMIRVVKKAKLLKEDYKSKKEEISFRLCSALINKNIDSLRRMRENDLSTENKNP